MIKNESVQKPTMLLELQGHEIKAMGAYSQGPVGAVASIAMYPNHGHDLEGETEHTCLTGSLSLGVKGRLRIQFFAEAIQVETDAAGVDRAVSPVWETRLAALCEEYQNAFETVEHEGRCYIIFITPSGR